MTSIENDSLTPPSLKRTALHSEHQLLGARLVPFAGYDMPVQYAGLIKEHEAVRKTAGLFDVSHMGILKVSGSAAQVFLNYICTRDLSTLTAGRAAYGLLCFENGGTCDDIIVYREGPESFFVVLNASNKKKDLGHLQKYKKLLGHSDTALAFEPLFDSHSLLALQGPQAAEIAKALGLASWQSPFHFQKALLAGIPVNIAFTGYTGEAGIEIFVENKSAVTLWKKILQSGATFGIQPCGLGARDTLRTEMGYSLYGHELSDSISPVEAGLSWAVGFKKTDFLGKTALETQKTSNARKLIALRNTTTKQAPRPEMKVFDSQNHQCGVITSGTFAPSLGYVVGLALVDGTASGPFQVEIRGQKVSFETTSRPFYKK